MGVVANQTALLVFIYFEIKYSPPLTGIEFDEIPDTNGVPLICDMSSNIMTRTFDVTKVSASL